MMHEEEIKYIIMLYQKKNIGWEKVGEADTIEQANLWCFEDKGNRCWRAYI